MKFTKESINKIADKGSEDAAKVLAKLSGIKKVTVRVSKAETVPFSRIFSRIKSDAEHPVVAYTQALSGVGVSVLIIEREDALVLVDLLSRNLPGTAGALKDFDRSAIKEVLNILSNAYVNRFADGNDLKIDFGSPKMTTAHGLESVLEKVVQNDDEETLSFQVRLFAEEFKLSVQMFIIFNEKIVEYLKEKQ